MVAVTITLLLLFDVATAEVFMLDGVALYDDISVCMIVIDVVDANIATFVLNETVIEV